MHMIQPFWLVDSWSLILAPNIKEKTYPEYPPGGGLSTWTLSDRSTNTTNGGGRNTDRHIGWPCGTFHGHWWQHLRTLLFRWNMYERCGFTALIMGGGGDIGAIPNEWKMSLCYCMRTFYHFLHLLKPPLHLAILFRWKCVCRPIHQQYIGCATPRDGPETEWIDISEQTHAWPYEHAADVPSIWTLDHLTDRPDA